ncbi:MAG TPA: zf-HC2 domain-containing protein [Haliangium sp.]|nr:zf-HC2 domain-containing protein [Haliangium sp.]
MPIRCTDIESLVQTYLDDELAEGESRELELHAGACESCRRHMVQAARFHERLRQDLAALAPTGASSELCQRVALALDQEDWRTRRTRTTWVLPGAATMAAAAALLLFVVTSLKPAERPTQPQVTEAAVLEHIRRPPLEVQGAAVSPWMRQHYSPTAQMPRFEGVRTVLRGGRLGQLRGRQAMQLYYDVLHGQRRHEVVVHVFDGRDIDFASGFPEGRPYRIDGNELWVGQLRGYGVVAHRDARGTAYLFTAEDLTGERLLDIVARADMRSDR